MLANNVQFLAYGNAEQFMTMYSMSVQRLLDLPLYLCHHMAMCLMLQLTREPAGFCSADTKLLCE